MAESKKIRCAIYTRKSSEEGLEQSFNSLHAQREACEAFIVSQRHEGWHALSKHYDDGGFSGGNIERPALRELLTDISHGRVDTVIVYKVDRLTRSLSDFAKIIERFDQHSVSFVSVTQQFNTTSSMGRLTLNVLLSFAQFEREVTGERIRDKIAASKKKGMWMGGNVPLGYDLKNRQLLVNESEARVVRAIFSAYLRLGCVSKLKSHLEGKSIRSKSGAPFSRGALYHLLRNRLYIGEIPHKGQAHQGQHPAIVNRKEWDAVDAKLRSNIQGEKRVRARGASLAGLIFDEHGNRFTPTHSTKGGKRYRYYTSQGAIRDDRCSPTVRRIPVHELEQAVLDHFSEWLSSKNCDSEVNEAHGARGRAALGTLRAQWRESSAIEKIARLKTLLKSVAVTPDQIEAEANIDVLAGNTQAEATNLTVVLQWPASFSVRRGCITIENADAMERISPALLKIIARSREWAGALQSGEIKGIKELASRTGKNERYVSRVLRACVLAPDLVDLVLEGRQSTQFTTRRIILGEIPLNWEQQRLLFV